MIHDKQLEPEIRVAAVDAHRRLPCFETRDRFLELFRDQEVDSEVRIAAYLQVMRCPDYITVRIVKHCLHEEEVNQGRCCCSHLVMVGVKIPTRSYPYYTQVTVLYLTRRSLNGIWFQWVLLFGVICKIY